MFLSSFQTAIIVSSVKKFGLAICCLLCTSIALAEAEMSSASAYGTFTYKNVSYHKVQVDLSHAKITPTAYYSPRLTSLWTAIGDRQPIAAITGTFFAFENQKPVADVVIDGKQVASGLRGSALAVDWFGDVRIFDPKVRQEADYFPYRYVLRGMVRIVHEGFVNPEPWNQGFKDRGIWGKARRTAIGITKHNKMILVATNSSVSLRDLGHAMVSQGASNAVSLDGGGSTSLYYMGNLKVAPNRKLSTMFMIEKKTPYDDVFHSHIRRIGVNQTSGAINGLLGQSSK